MHKYLLAIELIQLEMNQSAASFFSFQIILFYFQKQNRIYPAIDAFDQVDNNSRRVRPTHPLLDGSSPFHLPTSFYDLIVDELTLQVKCLLTRSFSTTQPLSKVHRRISTQSIKLITKSWRISYRKLIVNNIQKAGFHHFRSVMYCPF